MAELCRAEPVPGERVRRRPGTTEAVEEPGEGVGGGRHALRRRHRGRHAGQRRKAEHAVVLLDDPAGGGGALLVDAAEQLMVMATADRPSSIGGGEEGHEVDGGRGGGGEHADKALKKLVLGGVGLEPERVDVPAASLRSGGERACTCRTTTTSGGGEVSGGEEVGEPACGEEVEVGAALVRDGVDPHGEQLLAEVRVPVVLDLVVGAAGELGGDGGPLVAEEGVEVDDELLLVVGKPAALDVRAEVVCPAEAAALAAAVEPGELGQAAPAPVPVLIDVVDQQLVLLRRPRAFLHPRVLVAAR